jgi:hypothetical protein
MDKKIIRLTESDLHNIVKESVNKILSEMDWKTYMNAARKRKKQADDDRIPFSYERNSYDDKADELEKHAQKMFSMKHGKNGEDHNYEGESPSFMGRNSINPYEGDYNFAIKNKPSAVWKDDTPFEDGGAGDGSDVELRKYRYGNGFPHREFGKVHDDTLDHYHNWAWTKDVNRKHTMKYDKDGEHYDPYNSSVGNEISLSNDKDYNARQDAMSKDMLDYYTGKSKYTKGKGWE